MRILMLGWEFPPFISGGLGTACYGLTRALDRLGHKVLFVLPKAVDGQHGLHVDLLSPERGAADAMPATHPDGTPVHHTGGVTPSSVGASHYRLSQFDNVEFLGVPSAVRSPYREPRPGDSSSVSALSGGLDRRAIDALRAAGIDVPPDWEAELLGHAAPRPGFGGDYSGDVVGAAQTYARLVMRLCRGHSFDVVHAHDWMTYPAGMAIAQVSGKPFVAHIHSTEFDRSGEHVHQRVYDIERRGMHAAIRVVAVSMYTKSLVVQRYGIDPSKVEVIYNGIDTDGHQSKDEQSIAARDKIVLFLGRITMQKGPEYFIAAAKKVLEKVSDVKFIVAGSGDMDRRMIELAAELGIGHRVLFTGFLRGKDVARVFRMADCYVMPSVSEPFGIAPLEAISHDTPVIISKQSGVSEVLTHALKVDFWDINEMANKIVAVLKHPPLSQTLREHGHFEVRRLTWEGAADKCLECYRNAAESMTTLTQRAPAGV